MMKKIFLSPPDTSDQDLQELISAFNSGWIAPVGPYLDSFEEKISKYVGVNHCVALSSCTAAIHLALRVLGVSIDDWVLCPNFTFIGSVSPVLMSGAKPIFVDCDKDNYGICPTKLREAIIKCISQKRKPKAVIVAHLYGKPASIKEIVKIAKEYEISVIEDAAESLGSLVDGQHTGSFGDIGVYSFNGNKIITSSGGGALVSENSDHVEKARFLSQQAKEPDHHYLHREYGYNYRLSNILAALGQSQLSTIDTKIANRKAISICYKEALSKISDAVFLDSSPNQKENYWLTNIFLDPERDLDGIAAECLSSGFEVRRVWRPMLQQPLFAQTATMSARFEQSDVFFRSGLSLPSGSNLKPEEQSYVISTLKKILSR